MALADKLTVEAQIEVSDILYPLSQDEEVEFAVRVFELLAAPAQFVDEIRYRLWRTLTSLRTICGRKDTASARTRTTIFSVRCTLGFHMNSHQSH